MSQQKDNNFWYGYFKGFKAYLKSDKYPLNDTGISTLRIVDYKEKPIGDDTNPSYINTKIIGNSFVREDNSIYDNELNLVQSLVVGDSFLVDGTTYFLNSLSNVYEYGKQWNNSLLGDNGVSIVMGGGFDIKDDTDFSLWTAPQISLVFDKIEGVNALERVTTTTEKFFNFDIDIFVKETDSFESIDSTGYDELNRVDSLLNMFIYDYFNTVKCAHDVGNVSYVNHTYDLEKYIEDRPSLVAIKSNIITFR
jgi:hypothetical protein